LFRLFNDISIRSKLVIIVSGAVGALTLAVLIMVGISAERQVKDDVRHELQDSQATFVAMEGEHLHENLLEATAIAGSDALVQVTEAGDRAGACDWAGKILVGRKTPITPEDTFDLAAVILPDGKPVAIALAGQEPCGEAAMKWRFPGIATEANQGEITNWESPTGQLYELITVPVLNGNNRHGEIFILGFQANDGLALHIKKHTGRDAILWHIDEVKPHLLGTSDPIFLKLPLDKLLAQMVEGNGMALEMRLSQGEKEYSVMDTRMADEFDTIHNPAGLRIALVEPLDEKFEPFRKLERSLILIASLALFAGLMAGLLLSRPIARPLIRLADAAKFVSDGQLDEADLLIKSSSRRMGAKDEIGILGRSFLEMVKGLQERLAMSPFLSQATFEHIRNHTKGDAVIQRTSLAILFCDVRQFSKFAEARDPEVVIELLNKVLSIEAEIVKKHGGDVDKFVGDALVAWFSGDDRCLRAVRAADTMIKSLQSHFDGQPGTRIGAGIHVGEVVVGPIGSSARKDYTAIGSVVNMAARLCSSAQPGQVLISEAVTEELNGDVVLKPLPPISLKGFSEPVAVFEATVSSEAGIVR